MTDTPLTSRFKPKRTELESQSSGGKLADIRCASAVRLSSIYGACTCLGVVSIACYLAVDASRLLEWVVWI